MDNFKSIFQKTVLSMAAVIMLAVPLMVAVPVRAQPTIIASDPLSDNWELKAVIEEQIEKPVGVAILQVLLNLLTFVANRLAYDAAIAISSGGPGQTPLAEYRDADAYFEDVALDLLGESIGELSDGLEDIGLNFDVCAPADPQLRLNLQLGIAKGATTRSANRAPKCEFRNIQANWKSFVEGNVGEQGTQKILRGVAQQFSPGQSDLSAAIDIYNKTFLRANVEAQNDQKQLLANRGFKDVTDFISGNVETPASLLEYNLKEKVGKAQNAGQDDLKGALFGSEKALLQVGISAGSVFLNTLLSELTGKIYSGLFEAPNTGGVFDPDFINIARRESAREAYKDLLTAPISVIESYNVVNEFVACPGAFARGPNHCVLDTPLAAAITRADAGAPMTIQEAIDADLLHGDWPLIPPDDKSRNQDPFCYTYGYCHANLVKMRAARIIPAGFEIAAASIHNSATSPVTLRKVVNEFNNCNFDNPDNLVDANHPWCRMIDPNWVIKYPDTMCRAQVFGATLVADNAQFRSEVCVDTPSCIEEDDAGNCIGGFGYCSRERNVWRFGGDTCPAEFASCLTLTARTGGVDNYLINTVDFGQCNISNAGCYWYENDKGLREEDTVDPADDSYVFAAGTCSGLVNPGDACVTDEDCNGGSCVLSAPVASSRTYLDADAGACSPSDDGCTGVRLASDVELNLVRNGSFENTSLEAGTPDFWDLDTGVTFSDDGTSAAFGSSAVTIGDGSGLVSVETRDPIPLQPRSFVTVSWYVQEDLSTIPSLVLTFTDTDGNALTSANSVDVTTASQPECSNAAAGGPPDPSHVYFNVVADETYTRHTCTFSTPAIDTLATLEVKASGVNVDGIQMEYSEIPSSFHTAYSGSNEQINIKVPPDYLGCTGAATDPIECDGYAYVCLASEVGCSAYSPSSGNPTVPGIINETDVCPQECVGYETYRQLETNFSGDVFPTYFIADTARSCSAQYAGCDEFTNLDTIGEGGEQREYFTSLRVCQEIDEAGNTNATYYTWEGSDESGGYQLKTWSLKQSNASAAPCINFDAGSGLCTDGSGDLTVDECNEHADIFTNPDCREFTDSAGDVHYRLFSETITVSDACNPYRKTFSTEEDCSDSGGVWGSGGNCTYNILPAESITCPSTQNGCRGYAGNTGSNTRVVLSETFEEGDLSEWDLLADAMTYSNESVAREGHSMHLQGSARPFVVQDPAGCSEDSCTLESPSGATCTVTESDEEVACGTLVNQFTEDYSYIISFWAKGSGNLTAQLIDGYSLLGEDSSFGTVELSTGWQEFTLGPLEPTTQNDLYDASTGMLILTGTNAFVDNITLREVQATEYAIQNSWITPSTCDETLTGATAPQYHLGCQEYTDQNSDSFNLKSFSSICREEAIGCDAFYDSQNSESPYAAAYNLECENPIDDNGDGVPDAISAADGPTGCEMLGVDVCTILVNQNSCTFDWDGQVPAVLPSNILVKESAQFVEADEKIFLVDSADARCAEQARGCQVMGSPTFNVDRSAVTALDPVALLNLPDTYQTTLCEQEALFCEAYGTTTGSQYFFKDPQEQKCEFRDSVLIGGSRFNGWFQNGTDEPCYDTYLEDGTSYGIWRNGDTAYDGWVGECDSKYNQCSEFIDVADTQAGAFPEGRTYNFIKNDKISEENKSPAEKCEGLVSQKLGCVGFNDTTIPFLNFNASASYVRSIHADVFDKLEAFDPVTPIDCSNVENGEFTKASGGTCVGGADAGDSCTSDSDCEFNYCTGTTNLCQRRCAYNVTTALDDDGDPIKAIQIGDSCYISSDCPVIEDAVGLPVTGACTNPVEELLAAVDIPEEDGICASGTNAGLACNAPADGSVVIDPVCGPGAECTTVVAGASRDLVNDSNTIMKVRRDRTCAEWLACDSQFQTWDPAQNKYKNVCESVSLCNEFTNLGDNSFCSNWVDRPKQILDDEEYANRDVTWYGLEYAGYSISDQYGVQDYDQININPSRWCTAGGLPVNASGAVTSFNVVEGTWNSGTPFECSVPEDCLEIDDSGYECTLADTDYRLAVHVGPCIAGTPNGAQCKTGECSESGLMCASDSDCSVSSGETCELLSVNTNLGTCYNGQCVQTISGATLSPGIAELNECRGYPENASPFPNEIVTNWDDDNADDEFRDLDYERQPLARRTGFNHANIAAGGEIAECSYKKTEYGGGSEHLYTGVKSETPGSLCVGGALDGVQCVGDVAQPADVEPLSCVGQGGTCQFITSQTDHVGWTGYCIQRDGSINLLADQNEEACLLWLPVDQLLGSSDLNGKFTQAGFPINNTAYCVDSHAYVDLYVTNTGTDGTPDFACAESVRGEDYNTGNGPDGKCNENEWDSCWLDVICPNGYYAIAGSCDDSAGRCCEGGCEDGADDDCPYICVPNLSYKIEDGAEVACEIPDVPADQVEESDGLLPFYDPIDVYLVTNFEDYLEDYSECSRKGIEWNGDDYTNNYYYPVAASTSEYDSTRGYRDLYMAAEYYLGCKEIAFTAAEEGYNTLLPNETGNAAYTNRILSAGSAPYAIEVDDGRRQYTGQTVPAFGGRVLPDLQIQAGDSDNLAEVGVLDAAPVPVASCLGDTGFIYQTALPDTGCIDISYQNSNMARDYAGITLDDWSTPFEGPDNYAGGYVPDIQANNGPDAGYDTLSQFFAKVYSRFIFNHSGLGTYVQQFTDPPIEIDRTQIDDEHGSGPNDGTPSAPTVIAVTGQCVGDNCVEGTDDAFTLNGEDGEIFVVDGNFRADLRFFATTDPNQFPLRKVLVDWGDGYNSGGDADEWGRGSMSGSITNDNYYKAHRGLKLDQTPWCSDDEDVNEWGLTSESCEEGPFRFQHHYRCTPAMYQYVTQQDGGRLCNIGDDGRITNSPCTIDGGSCVFQPRVYVEDNWGYCAGECGTESSIGGEGCYGTDGEQECDYAEFPNTVLQTRNPWINYNGYIVVTP